MRHTTGLLLLQAYVKLTGVGVGHLRILLMSIAEHLRKHPLAACTLPRGPLSIHGRSISIWICHKFSSLAILSALLQDRCFSDGENIWGKLATCQHMRGPGISTGCAISSRSLLLTCESQTSHTTIKCRTKGLAA